MNHNGKRSASGIPTQLSGGMSLEQARAQQEQRAQLEAQQRVQQEILSAKDYDPESADFIATPINDQIVFRRIAAAPLSDTIVAPDSVRDQFLTWEVLAVGQGHLVLDGSRVPLLVQPGDHVIVSGQLITQMHNGRTIWVGKENQILVKLARKNAPEN